MTRPRRLVQYGPRAVLAEYDSLDDVIAATRELRRRAPAGVVDIIPAARTILVTTTGVPDVIARVLADPIGESSATVHPADTVTVPVRYDGVDLADVADRCGLRADDVVALHSGALYTVGFCGFLPGFSYLVGLDPRLHLPRRATPRTSVPAGAVAIASEFTAVYPSPSPGGWHLLGTTDAVMWDDARDVPALLPPGVAVRFEPV
jgi:KipI family sensor histidine kinase inhibitor